MHHDHSNHPHHSDPGYVGHADHEQQLESNLPNPAPHQHEGHGQHGGHDRHAGHSPEMFKRRFFICLVLTLPILYFSPLFQEWFRYQAIDLQGSNWITPILATVIYFYGGWAFLKGAWYELRGKIGMMTLIALAITVAFVYSLAVTFGLPGDPFYWELATLVDVMLLGHWIEMASVQGASRALEHLADLVPAISHRLTNGRIEDVSVSTLTEHDRILIRPGEQIPIDGEITEGASSVNEAFLTGESRPVTKQMGDEVVGGAVNGEGALTVQVTRTGDKTTLSQIMRLVEEAQSSRSRYQALADQLAYWLTLIAIGVSTLTFVVWLAANSGLTFAINRAVTVLVITCPHALGLAIPLVIVNATAMSAKNGILVRSREAFERARDIKAIAFDKTGTLTEGRFGVQHMDTDGINELDALTISASLESLSEHPLGQAIVGEAEHRQIHLVQASEFKAIPGRGVEGTVNAQRYRVGRPEWAEELNLTFPSALRKGLQEIESRGESAIVLLNDQQVLAVIGLADQIRERAREAIQRLHEMNIETVMITGDAEAVAKTVAAELGIDRYYARVLPQDKATLVRRLKAEKPTAFVGDGINDAPALFEADLGIAIGAGTNVAIESADLVLVKNDPLDATYALQLAKATYNKMIQNLFWSTGYNVIGIPLAAGIAYPFGILLSPAVGALFMSISTVIVSINAMLLRRVKLSH
ncbi:heavy metal translocating P-type ATPase [Leptolyngbya boryana NIES-2135]|jgi:Cu2+-exporting ATPase|uniref:Heavy metal translocating P-type ATPase n=1 Tax=Leptolyngbya boryana NIES-2135 TaxID=1973484 RepID=A0A1Z4JE07_LEPBY|nr:MULTISPECIES: heavy metal translocating P-type ATPase [Leptolyngbya]BAY54976.1 heavy metal translocating P-type ATPase [Leptolyngbya boryana NIES-2135]MBD2365956.1 heavy metal translocating P-type ATPase [Leptolyngbya sp. FACHB-161]MBD2372136.1 heavy metal translocating P-type ATPase [Leptolyngbya sp. FACHB-238]MBD2396559.1 heavy metal translocating P-type ATPase [Leptolyngbya sp. FACHB-239]MBD2403082.1 heavy metal translocating P-type ATPase [Leptolyngbya sp. FACHB-402]